MLFEGFHHLAGKLECQRKRQAPETPSLVERFTIDKLHHQKKDAPLFDNFEDLAYERMAQRSGGGGFGAEALLSKQWKCFHRYQAAQFGISGAIHLTHSASSNGRKDLVASEFRPVSEWQGYLGRPFLCVTRNRRELGHRHAASRAFALDQELVSGGSVLNEVLKTFNR